MHTINRPGTDSKVWSIVKWAIPESYPQGKMLSVRFSVNYGSQQHFYSLNFTILLHNYFTSKQLEIQQSY